MARSQVRLKFVLSALVATLCLSACGGGSKSLNGSWNYSEGSDSSLPNPVSSVWVFGSSGKAMLISPGINLCTKFTYDGSDLVLSDPTNASSFSLTISLSGEGNSFSGNFPSGEAFTLSKVDFSDALKSLGTSPARLGTRSEDELITKACTGAASGAPTFEAPPPSTI